MLLLFWTQEARVEENNSPGGDWSNSSCSNGRSHRGSNNCDNGHLMKVVKSKNQITAQPNVIANENMTVSQLKEGASVQPTKRHTLSSNWSFA